MTDQERDAILAQMAALQASEVRTRTEMIATLEQRITDQLEALAKYQNHESDDVAVAATAALGRLAAVMEHL